MSETNTPTAPEHEAPPPPVDPPAPQDPGTPEPAQRPQREANNDRIDRRLATMTARLAAAERALGEATQRMEQMGQAQPIDPQTVQLTQEQEAVVEARTAQRVAQLDMQRAGERFHDVGRAAFSDWADRCQSLVQMGADAAFSALLVDMADGPKVAASLADDPEAVERISAIRTERGRAIALGKYAAGLPEQAPRRRVSEAPPPIRPVNGASAVAVPNEREMTVQQLTDLYAAQAMDRRRAAQVRR